MAERVGAVDVQVDVLITQGLLPNMATNDAIAIFERAIQMAESASLLHHLARAHNNLAVLTSVQAGNLSLGIHHYRKAAETSRLMGATSQELFCAANAVINEVWQGKLFSAQTHLESLMPLRDELIDPGSPADLNFKTAEAVLMRNRGELQQACASYRELRQEANTAGDLQSLSSIDFNLGRLLIEMGEFDEAEIVLLEALEIFDRLPLLGDIAVRSLLSIREIRRGNPNAANRWLDEARQREKNFGAGVFDTFWKLIAERHLAVAEQDWPQARTAFESFMELVEETGMRWYRAQGLNEWAEALLSRAEPGDEQKACELLLEARDEFKDMGAPYYISQIERILQGLG
jgi:tetratricopeptide (TPR) repeat protein